MVQVHVGFEWGWEISNSKLEGKSVLCYVEELWLQILVYWHLQQLTCQPDNIKERDCHWACNAKGCFNKDCNVFPWQAWYLARVSAHSFPATLAWDFTLKRKIESYKSSMMVLERILRMSSWTWWQCSFGYNNCFLFWWSEVRLPAAIWIICRGRRIALYGKIYSAM